MCTINNSFAAIYNVEVARENEKLMRYLKIAHSCFSLYVADKQQNIQRKMHFISSYATDFLECKPVLVERHFVATYNMLYSSNKTNCSVEEEFRLSSFVTTILL